MMSTIVIHDLEESKELDAKAMSKISGGRMKLPSSGISPIFNAPLAGDGQPYSVYVDGLLVNSVRTGG
jgi:hypothetical protein